LVPDTISATFDNSNGSNESVRGAYHNKKASFEDRGDNDLTQNIVQAKEMAKEVIQIASARAESFYNELFQLLLWWVTSDVSRLLTI